MLERLPPLHRSWLRIPGKPNQRFLTLYSRLAGRTLPVDEAVFHSERRTGHRDRAIGRLLRNSRVILDYPEPALQLYFRQCSVLANACDLAVMAASLACQGRHPFTSEQLISAETCRMCWR